MEKGKILFIDTTHQILPDLLAETGFKIDHFESKSKTDLLAIANDYQGFIVRSKFVLDKDILDSASNLSFIGRLGAGMENIDVLYAESKGIRCFNSPEGNRNAVAEQAMGMILSLFNNINKADSEVRQGIWKREENRGIELEGKTIGIIGYGNTGSTFAKKLSGFEVKILAYDKYKKDFSNSYVQESNLDDLFQNCDILSLHIPLNEETIYMVDKDFLTKFKKDIFLINTSRGKILKTKDLVELMEMGRIKGACLDVLEYEGTSFEALNHENMPQAFNKLVKMPNVVLTPHIAGWTHESNVKLSRVLATKIIELFED